MNLFTLLFPLVIHGHITPEDPAILRMKSYHGPYIGHCTGVMVSGNKILTAGHCIEQGARYSVVSRGREIPTTFKTAKHLDLAVGLLSEALEVEAFVPAKPDPKKPVTLTGFGCFNEHQDQDDIFRTGEAEISRIDVDRFETSGLAQICPGDSGGPVIQERGVVGINSAVFADFSGSILIRVDSPEAKALLTP